MAYFFLVEKMNYVFFLFLEIGNSFFWCCNTCCISCSIRHQSVHFFSKNVNRQSLDDIFSQVQGDSYRKVTYFQNIPNKIKLLSSVSLMDFIHKSKYLLLTKPQKTLSVKVNQILLPRNFFSPIHS